MSKLKKTSLVIALLLLSLVFIITPSYLVKNELNKNILVQSLKLSNIIETHCLNLTGSPIWIAEISGSATSTIGLWGCVGK